MASRKGYRLCDIVKIADMAYREGNIVWHSYKGLPDLGDTLAEFIARELTDTFDPDATKAEQLEDAERAMEAARMQISDVELELHVRLEKLRRRGK